jgi:hypothetical protein
MNALGLLGAGGLSPDNLGEVVIKGLAVAGGVLVGAIGSGLLVQLLVRLTTTARVPKRVLQVVRVLGAAAGGLAVALFVFNSGGGPGGGGWGWFGGGGGGTGREGTVAAPAGPTARETPAPAETGREPRGTAREEVGTLRVEVLVDRRDNATAFRPEGSRELLRLADLEKQLRFRRAQATPLRRLELVIYLDSPDRDSGAVKELLGWARREGLETSIATPATNAPG